MNSVRNCQEIIEAYLDRVKAGLRNLPHSEVLDILAELRSHIMDRCGGQNGLDEANVQATLRKLGPPAELAVLYSRETMMARAEVSRSPLLIVSTLFRLAMRSVWASITFLLCTCGYLLLLPCLLGAMLKPFYPDRDGLWWNSETHSFAVGLIWPGTADRELMGWWIIPLGLLAAAGIFIAVTAFARWNIRRWRRSGRRERNAGNSVSFETQD
jgi:hypothetical protein